MKIKLNHLVLFGCLVLLTLTSGCVLDMEARVPAYSCYSTPVSHTLAGFTPDGVPTMQDRCYSGNVQYTQTYLVPGASYNVCGPTVVPVCGGPIIYSGGAVIGGWRGDQFGGGQVAGQVYRPGNAATGH